MNTDLSLSKRTGLPDALRVLVRDLPRADWSLHPNFGGMVQFWLDRHLGFRRLHGILTDDIQALVDNRLDADVYRPRLARFGGMLLNELHMHHQIEDAHYFPTLAKFDARIERGFDLLDGDHKALDPILHDMATGANAVLENGAPGPLIDRLAVFGKLLDRHLVDEEDLVVPVLLKSGFQA